MENTKKKKKFKLFDMNRDGKGVDPGEDTTPNLKYFFKLFGRKFSKILSINMLMIFQVIPLAICLYLYFFASPTTPSVSYTEFPLLYGMQQASGNAVTAARLNLFSFQLGLPTFNTYIYWVIGILLFVHFATYGLQKVGSVYVTRGLVRGDSVFTVSDYFYAIKKNWKQGLGLGILDCTIWAVLIYDFMYFYSSPVTPFNNFMYVMTIALVIIYVIMRFYIYLLIITFNIKLSKAFKNALIFTVLGIKRNLMACLGLAIITAVAIGMLFLIPMGLGVAVVLPLVYYLGVAAFMYCYAAYPVIKKYMIDPPIKPDVNSDGDEDGDPSYDSSPIEDEEPIED